MSDVKEVAQANAIGKNVGMIVGLLFCGFVANWIWGIWDVDPEKTYGWFRGFISGSCFPSNYLLSFFRDDVVIKDVLHTGAYNFWWWCGCIWASAYVIINALALIVNIKVLKNN